MEKRSRKRVAWFVVIGFFLVVLGGQIEYWTGYNPDFGTGYTLKQAIQFIGLIWLAVSAVFAAMLLFWGEGPSPDQIDRHERYEFGAQLIVCIGNLVMFSGFLIAALLSEQHELIPWFLKLGFAGLFIAGIASAWQIRVGIFSLKVPSLNDERHQAMHSKAAINGFSWMHQSALIGALAYMMFNVQFPIWFAFVGPVVLGHLGINWSLLKQIWEDNKREPVEQ